MVVDMWYDWGLRWISSDGKIEGVATKTEDLVGYPLKIVSDILSLSFIITYIDCIYVTKEDYMTWLLLYINRWLNKHLVI